jgi:thiamine-phosphate pyrophosphorylase
MTNRPLDLLDALLRAGITVVQLRAKAGVDFDLLAAMLERTRAANARLIVNDDFEAACAADGWHAGQEDLAGRDLGDLRQHLGARLFGISCGTPNEAVLAERAGADYVGTGPFATTATKTDAGIAIGVAGLAAVVGATRLPVVAIGGIDARNLLEVARSGVRMAAIISAIARAPDPESTTRALRSIWAGTG